MYSIRYSHRAILYDIVWPGLTYILYKHEYSGALLTQELTEEIQRIFIMEKGRPISFMGENQDINPINVCNREVGEDDDQG